MENLRIILWAGFALLLYATYSQWSYEPPEQQAAAQEYSTETPTNETAKATTNKPNNNDVLSLSDAIPTINKNNPVEDVVSTAVETTSSTGLFLFIVGIASERLSTSLLFGLFVVALAVSFVGVSVEYS